MIAAMLALSLILNAVLIAAIIANYFGLELPRMMRK